MSDTDVVERVPTPGGEPAPAHVVAPPPSTPAVPPMVFEPTGAGSGVSIRRERQSGPVAHVARRRPTAPDLDDDIHPVVRFVPPSAIVPVIGDVTSGPEFVSMPSADGLAGSTVFADPLPAIVEATPWTDVTTVLDVLDAPVVLEVPDEPAVNDGVPRLPAVPQPEPRPASVSGDGIYELPTMVAASTSHKKKRSRRGRKVLITLVLLGGLIAAGVFIGKPYFFPGDWEARTAPYATAVETSRGVEFVEPLDLIAEPAADFDVRSGRELLGSWSSEQPMWRALGLSNGAVDEQTVSELFAEWRSAVYSTDDGQVYVDDTADGPELDAEITMAMSDASLDQEFGWSIGQPTRTLDDVAAISAEVLRQSRAVLQDSPSAAALEAPQLAVLSFAPPVLGYRVLAANLFAEFDNGTTDGANPLSHLDEGVGALPSGATTVASGPALIDGDVALTSPRALDRSFWYLVLAGRLDSSTAYSASEAIVENAVVTADRGGTQCVYATFAGGDLIQTDSLRSALEAWSAAAPAEFASVFGVLDDGSLQLVSCDPGVGFDSGARSGVARELASWRLAELATIEHVRVAGGTDVDAAWALVSTSNAADALMALPPETPATEMAAAARDAVTAVLTPTG